MKNTLGLLILFFAITSCATPAKRLTRAEWLEMTTREYKNTTVNEVLTAGEQVFLLADESDMKIAHYPNKLIASRFYNVYLIFTVDQGFFNYQLNATQEGDNVNVQLTIANQPNIYSPVMTVTPGAGQGGNPQIGVGAAVVPSGPGFGHPDPNQEVYQLFFERLDALLKGGKWVTCNEMAERMDIKKGIPTVAQKEKARKSSPLPHTTDDAETFNISPSLTELRSLCHVAADKSPPQKG